MQHLAEMPAPAPGETKSSYTIGDLAQEFGVTLRTLRFYEDRNLVTPRRQGTMRLYSRRDRARLKLVLLGRRVGFSLAEIAEVINLYDLKDGQAAQLRAALAKFARQIETLREQKRDVEQAIQELTRTVEVVSGMLRDRESDGSEEILLEAAE